LPILVATTLPVADIAFADQQALPGQNPQTPLVGHQVAFSGQGSWDPDGVIVAYAWELDGDGEYDDGSHATAGVSFSEPGTKSVGLEVTDNEGGKDEATVVFDVGEPSPPALPPPPESPPPTPPSPTESPPPAIESRL
jgi:hypothetical protein